MDKRNHAWLAQILTSLRQKYKVWSNLETLLLSLLSHNWPIVGPWHQLQELRTMVLTRVSNATSGFRTEEVTHQWTQKIPNGLVDTKTDQPSTSLRYTSGVLGGWILGLRSTESKPNTANQNLTCLSSISTKVASACTTTWPSGLMTLKLHNLPGPYQTTVINHEKLGSESTSPQFKFHPSFKASRWALSLRSVLGEAVPNKDGVSRVYLLW